MQTQTQEQAQFATLLQDSKGAVYSAIRSYCWDKVTQDDLFQEVSIRAWEAFDKFSGASKFSTWIYGIARNAAIDRLRRQKSSKTVLYDNIFWEIADTEYKEDSVGLPLSIIDSFSEAEKRTLQMRIDGLSFPEISKITGEPANRLIIRMHRIKRLLSTGRKVPKKPGKRAGLKRETQNMEIKR
jgi:RNA polymerase sigma-70 factor, ECF subfamily